MRITTEYNGCIWEGYRASCMDLVWGTECGKDHYFTDGTWTENGYVFCPYCGGRIHEKEEEK